MLQAELEQIKTLCIKIRHMIRLNYDYPPVAFSIDNDKVIFTIYAVVYHVPISDLENVRKRLFRVENTSPAIENKYKIKE